MKSFKITQSITERQDASLGMYFKDVSKQPLIDINEEIALTKKIKEGDKAAVDALVKANLRFVISVAKQYQNKGLDLVDLVQEGNIGLIEAAKRYDETRGFRFISYAVWWIRQSIMHAISDQCRTVRIPMSQVVYMNKINKATAKFEQEHGRKPSPEEIEEETNLSSDKISFTLSSSSRAVSLETPFKDEEAGCLLDVLPNENCEDTDRQLVQSSVSQELEDVLNKLSFRERDILKMAFGLGMTPMQNEEIASRFDIGCERVRQIQHEAIDEIKTNYRHLLKELL
nr:RNA polymerase sigma factor RpoD/SigA [Bacteroides intestinalis]